MLKLLPKDKMPHGFGFELKEQPKSKRKKVLIPQPKPNESPEFLAAKEQYMERKKVRELKEARKNQPIDMTKLLGGN